MALCLLMGTAVWPRLSWLLLLILCCGHVRGGAICQNYTTIPDITRDEPATGIFYVLPNYGGEMKFVSSDVDSITFNNMTRSLSNAKPINPGTTGSIYFVCTDSPSTRTGVTLTLVVRDVNNHWPFWQLGGSRSNMSTVVVNEGPRTVGSQIPPLSNQPRCMGGDSIFVDQISLAIIPGRFSNKFSMVSASGANALSLRIESALDHEASPQINLTIRCYDYDKRNVSRLVGTADFLLMVVVNNTKEKGSYHFELPRYEATIRANATVGTTLTTLPRAINATNPAAEMRVYPQYSIFQIAPRIENHFTINNLTGVITLVRAEPSPRYSPYTVTLSVVLRGETSPTNRTKLIINVLPAVYTSPTFSSDSISPVSILESQALRVPFKTIEVVYPEIAGTTPLQRNLTFTVLSHAKTFGFARCFQKSCGLMLTRTVDYEKKADRFFALNISVADGITPPITAVLNVTVTDVNDNIPQFEKNDYKFTVKKREIDEIIGTVKATDYDAGTKIKYLISTNGTRYFSINAETGVITFKADPNKLTNPTYSFTVKASDGKNMGTVLVVVQLGTVVSTAAPMLAAVASLGAVVLVIFIITIIGCCIMRKRAEKRRDKQLPVEMGHDNTVYSYGVAGMTTLQENPVFGDIYGEEDGLEMDMYKSDRDVSEIQLSDTGGMPDQSTMGGSIRTMMSNSTSSFLGNSQTHLIPNGNSIKLSTNSMELVAADNAVSGSPIDTTTPDGKDELTIYY